MVAAGVLLLSGAEVAAGLLLSGAGVELVWADAMVAAGASMNANKANLEMDAIA